MVEIQPTDGPGQFAVWKRDVDRRLNASDTARRTPFTDFYDGDGNLLGSLSAEGLRFFGPGGAQVSRLDGDGLTVFDDDGNAQLRAGDLDGMGDYGVEIGGGRARAFDMETLHAETDDVLLTTTPSPVVTVDVVPPPWALRAHLYAWLTFQMGNHRAGLHRQRYRIDIAGSPGGVGYWNNDVAVNSFANVTDVQRLSLDAPFSTIPVQGIAGVDIGTNDDNFLRLHVFAWFTR